MTAPRTVEMTALPADALLTDAAQPDPEGGLDALYDGGEAGELRLPLCTREGHPLDPRQSRCEICGAGPEWRAVEPHGRVRAVVVMHRIERRLVAVEHPYAIYDVELASGHRLYLAADDPGAPIAAAGDEVTIGWIRLGARAVPRITTHHNERSTR